MTWRKVEQRHTARSLEIQKEFNNDPNVYEPKIESDREMNSLNDDLDEISRKTKPKLVKQRDEALATLKTLTAKLKDATDTFEAHITKKEKSINPFKGKKSVPTAKDAIKCARELIAKNQKLF